MKPRIKWLGNSDALLLPLFINLKAGVMSRFYPLFIKLKETAIKMASQRDSSYAVSSDEFIKQLRK